MTQAREAAIKRITDAGGTWPPVDEVRSALAWLRAGTTRRRCTECGYESRPLTSTCALCGERLHAGH